MEQEQSLPLRIVNEFVKLQRSSTVAEIMYAKGQFEMMQKCLYESVLAANKINALTGGASDKEAEPHNKTNPSGDEAASKQSRSKAKSANRKSGRKR